jgi:chromosome segregation ATPase
VSERRGVTFERLNRMECEYADDDDVLDVISAVKHLAPQVEDLQRQLAEAVGQAEAAKQATREIMAERNTWARQLADMRDERNTARNEAERQRGLASEASVDRDNLCVAVERVIEEWERSAARPLDNPMLNWQSRHAAQLRRALAPWLTT